MKWKITTRDGNAWHGIRNNFSPEPKPVIAYFKRNINENIIEREERRKEREKEKIIPVLTVIFLNFNKTARTSIPFNREEEIFSKNIHVFPHPYRIIKILSLRTRDVKS